MKKKLIAGNWKMNGTLAANASLLRSILDGLRSEANCLVAVCVPAPYLAQVHAVLGGTVVQMAAQDVSAHASGAYTGEVSAQMLREFAVRYCLVATQSAANTTVKPMLWWHSRRNMHWLLA